MANSPPTLLLRGAVPERRLEPAAATKVPSRCRLKPAFRLGTVGGDHLNIRTAQAEFAWPVTELHDLGWNSIAKAMRE